MSESFAALFEESLKRTEMRRLGAFPCASVILQIGLQKILTFKFLIRKKV